MIPPPFVSSVCTWEAAGSGVKQGGGKGGQMDGPTHVHMPTARLLLSALPFCFLCLCGVLPAAFLA